MAKLLTIISLVLALVLFPPAALAVISNNAVPGDATYPIKRALEDGIFAIASLNPTTRAWFAAARSDRRFKEFTTLVAQGKKTSDTLNELVEQTQIAANQIANVSDEVQKEKLAAQLAQSIQKYDQGLQQLSPSSLPQATPVPQETSPASPPKVEPTASPTIITPRPTSTPASVVQPTPVPVAQLTPTPTATFAPTPAPAPHPSDEERQRQIEEARRRLEEIKRRLEEQRRQDGGEHRRQNEGTRQQTRQENRENDKKDDSKDRSKRGKDDFQR